MPATHAAIATAICTQCIATAIVMHERVGDIVSAILAAV